VIRKLVIAGIVVLAITTLGVGGIYKLLDNAAHRVNQAASQLPSFGNGGPSSGGSGNSGGSGTQGPGPSGQNAGQPPVGSGLSGHYTVQSQPSPGSCHYRVLDAGTGYVLPDPTCTPGATNPAVTQADLSTTICRKGFTSGIRPPTSITSREKAANKRSYGYTGSSRTGEYDHLISLELGGSPNDARNLWVEPNRSGATGTNNPKDKVEGQINSLVCNAVHGQPYLPLAVAQRLVATNWTTAIATAQKDLVTR